MWIGFLILLLGSAQAAPSPVSLEQAYQAALTKTETVSVAQSRLKQSDAREKQINGRFLPKLSLGGSWQRQDRTWGHETHTDEVTTRLTLSQSIFVGGQDTALSKMRKNETASLKHRLTSTQQDLYANVAKSYYAVLAAESEYGNIQKAAKLAQERIDEMRKRMNIGRSKNSDVLAARAQLAVLQAQLLSAQGQLAVARDSFTFITGLGLDAKLAQPETKTPTAVSLDSLLKALDTHPEIEELRLRKEMSLQEARAAASGHYPSLDLTSNYYLSHTGRLPRENYWDLTLGLTIPLYSGGIIQAQVREAKEKEVEAELLLKQKRRELEAGVRSVHNTLTSTLEQVKSLEQALSVTEQNYQEQVKEYRFSLATNIDVIQALNSFQDTKRTFDRARFQAWTAWAELKSLNLSEPR